MLEMYQETKVRQWEGSIFVRCLWDHRIVKRPGTNYWLGYSLNTTC